MSRYIDADKLKSEFPIRRNNYDEEHGDVHFINGIESVFEYIDYMPTADVEEVRHGEWIKPYKHQRKSYVRICNNCHRKSYTIGEELERCPHCGAHMLNANTDLIPLCKCPICGAKMDGGKK